MMSFARVPQTFHNMDSILITPPLIWQSLNPTGAMRAPSGGGEIPSYYSVAVGESSGKPNHQPSSPERIGPNIGPILGA